MDTDIIQRARFQEGIARIVALHNQVLAQKAKAAKEKAPEVPAHPSIRRLANALGVTSGAVIGPSRRKAMVSVRHAMAWHLRVRRGLTCNETGRRLHRNHATIIYAVRKVGSNPAKYARWLDAMEAVHLERLPLKPVGEKDLFR